MTNRKDDGGPALKSTAEPSIKISLRDWFAGMADEDDILDAFNIIKRDTDKRPTRQQCRYYHADQMLKARDQ